jgi:flagellar hook-basal body complex protein FliE
MDMKISGAIQAYTQALKKAPVQTPEETGGAGGANPAGQSDFGKLVSSVLDDVNNAGKASEMQALQAINGKADVTEIVAAVSNAEVALETVVAVRDKVISAYQEIMRMPI